MKPRVAVARVCEDGSHVMGSLARARGPPTATTGLGHAQRRSGTPLRSSVLATFGDDGHFGDSRDSNPQKTISNLPIAGTTLRSFRLNKENAKTA